MSLNRSWPWWMLPATNKFEFGASMCYGRRKTHPDPGESSYDDTAGRTLAQNHRDKQNSRLPQRKIRRRERKQPQAKQRLVCYSPGGSQLLRNEIWLLAQKRQLIFPLIPYYKTNRLSWFDRLWKENQRRNILQTLLPLALSLFLSLHCNFCCLPRSSQHVISDVPLRWLLMC